MTRRRSHAKKGRGRVLRDTRESPAAAPGTAPGTLRIDPEAPKPIVRVVRYGPEGCAEHPIAEVDEIRQHLGPGGVTWVDVSGLGDAAVLVALGDLFGLHALALEDVINVNQRAKVETYDEHAFVVARMPRIEGEHVTEQLGLFVHAGVLLSFQEFPGDCFDPVRERIRHGKGRVRTRDADYLAYALIDAAIDAFFPVLDRFGDRLEELEEAILERPTPETMVELHQVRRDLISLRKAILPHREMLNTLLRSPIEPFREETLLFLRDCYDHTLRLVEILEGYREFAASLMELYLSGVSNRTNDVMKVLTMISTIFIPLSFLAGLYGMNFDPKVAGNMPELGAPYAYPVLLGIMGAIAGSLLWYFRRKRWL